MKSKNIILLIWLLISTLTCIFLYTCMYDIHRGTDMISTNDEWEHQSLAVNYAEGFGLYKLGAFTDIEKYHIDSYDAAFPFLRKIFTDYPTEYYHRASGFSLIAGTIYKITGTHPFFLRIFNFVIIILSWLVICYTVYKYHPIADLSFWMLVCLPFYLCLNFNYIDLIGDDTLVVFTFALVFYAITRWMKNASYFNSFLLMICFLISIIIKSTVLFIPGFVLIYSFLFMKRSHIVQIVLINTLLFFIVIIYSTSINNRHQRYNYVNQDIFHNDMLNSKWTKHDSGFIEKYKPQYKNELNTDFETYKKVATYLFERQFYTKSKLFLSGQSWYLLIDGNNEACIGFPEKHMGSWKPFWKFFKHSYFYNYDDGQSPYLEVFKFYLHNPLLFPFIMYSKLYAGYYWNYLFILFSGLQLFFVFLVLFKPLNRKRIFIFFCLSAGINLIFYFFYLTPFVVVTYFITSLYLYKVKEDIFDNQVSIISYSFIFYFIFLTLLLFGLNRYTGIVNGFVLFAIIQLVFAIKLYFDKLIIKNTI